MSDRMRSVEERFRDYDDDPVSKPGDDDYVEVRSKLLEQAQTPEESTWVQERYPFWTPALQAEREQAEAEAERKAQLDEALEGVTDPDEYAEIIEQFAEKPSPRDEEYEKEVSKAGSPEELDEVYRRFDKPVPTR